jgi:nickel-dependent lactate racemase
MQQHLAFGKDGITIDLPPGFQYQILDRRSASSLEDPATAIAQALDSPIGCPPLQELARGRRSAAIAVCDITRPAPNRQILPHVLSRLEQGGIPRNRILILIATGLHRGATPEEIQEICGDEIASSYTILNHDARAASDHRYLGTTTGGTPAYVDERFVAADLRMTLGLIKPHLMLGFSGGRKMVAPGLAGQETIKTIHSPRFMRDARAVEGSIENNPLHSELLQIARMARQDFIVDVSLSSDRSIAGVFAGAPEPAHRRGVEFVSSLMLETLEQPVDAVITTAAGYPLDLTFYQAVKGITAAAHIVRPGGIILLMAACEEGAGAAEFRRMLLDHPSHTAFLDHIAKLPVVPDQWQLEKLALVANQARLLFYVPGLPVEFHASLWGQAFPTAAAAVRALTSSLPATARIAVIPEGPYVLARTLNAAADGEIREKS